MCLYPKLIRNRKYTSTKKNGGIIPTVTDNRVLYVTAACGKCYECRKQKARAWTVRICEELRHNPNAGFVTLTISDESFKKIEDKYGTTENETVKKMVRLFLERIRKEKKTSRKHWFITEKGHNNTERIHLHGIIWGTDTDEICKKYWKYGHVFIGTHVNEQTANYIVKYMYKVDLDHKDYQAIVLCSPGIGEAYITREDAKRNKYRGEQTKETYRLRNGTILNLPNYYRNKIYTEEEREALFINKIDKGIVWVCGQKIDINDEETYHKVLHEQQIEKQHIHGDDPIQWDINKYTKRLRKQRRR